MRLDLRATSEEVMRAVEALRESAQGRQIPERTLFGLTVALEECASNIVNHALRRDARQRFRVSIEHTDATVTIELRDPGPAFDPSQHSAAPPTDDDRPPGGWGLQLVRRYTDEIHYQRQGGENVLRLVKRLA